MKKIVLRITLAACILLTSLVWGGSVYAQDEELPDPGMTPDNPFYFLDGWGKSISLFFTFGDEVKAGKALRYAEERLSEAQVMAAENRTREMTRAANDFEGFMAMVNERLEAAAENGNSDNISGELAGAACRFHTWLGRIKDKLPEQSNETTREARATLETAETNTINSQINALVMLGENRPERALDIGCETVERLMERVRARVSDNATGNTTRDISEILDYAARIAALEDEMAAIAEEKGIDVTQIQTRLARSSEVRLQTLSRVYENAPEAALNGIENAIENSVKRYERVVERLRGTEASAAVSANATAALEDLPEKVKTRLHVENTLAAINRNRELPPAGPDNQEQNQPCPDNNNQGNNGEGKG